MKQNPINDIVEARLDALRCNPAPALVKERLTKDFRNAVVQLAEATITEETFAKATRDVFWPKKKRKGNSDHDICPEKA